MTSLKPNRRALIAGAAVTFAAPALIRPARAEGFAPTPTMRGGANNYRPGAALTDRIGGGGFLMTGSVRRAGDGAPIDGARIQMWAHTTEGHERDPESHGATLTNADGYFEMDMPQIVPAFGQPHGHLAYDAEFDDNGFETVFLRPIMGSASDTTLHVDFVLVPA
ncbi:MAG: twin-arginine translocation pathway signal [Pseudomonadota bacterium]